MNESDNPDANEDLDRPADPVELLGVKIEHFGPIRRCYLLLESPFIVLYGLNGAGKTHVLDALAKAFDRRHRLNTASRRSSETSVKVYVRPSGWTMARTVDPNPWDPWQALWTGARAWIDQELSDIRAETDAVISNDELAVAFARRHTIPYLERATGQSIPLPDSPRDMSYFVRILTDLLIAADPARYVTYAEEGAFDEEAAVFWPVAEAFLERRLIVETTSGSVHLGVAQEGRATREWAEQVERVVREHVEVPFRLEDFTKAVRLYLDAGGDKEELTRIIAEVRDEEVSLAPGSSADSVEADGTGRMPLEDAIASFDKEGAEAMWDPLSDEFGTVAFCLEWDSVVAEVIGAATPPVWAADVVLSHGHDPGPLPYVLLDESRRHHGFGVVGALVERREDEAARAGPHGQFYDMAASLAELESRIEAARSVGEQRDRGRGGGSVDAFDVAPLIREVDGGFVIDPELTRIAGELAGGANRIFQVLMPGAPELVCRIAPIHRWSENHPIQWGAIDASGVEIQPDSLSAAQQRWALFSLQLADTIETRAGDAPIIVLIDEPERALHRRAERQLAAGLASIAVTHDLRLIVASHSPAFLAHRPASLQHVHRSAAGTTVVEPVPDQFFERAGELGLDATDLLQLCRGILLVEGQHELVILDELIGDELRELGVEMLCMRGATALKTWDAQLIQRYTDVPFVVLVDNDQADRLSDIWNRARAATDQGDSYIDIVDELKSGARGSEGEFLRELCKNLIGGDEPGRYYITAFEAADIPEYLPPAVIAPSTGTKTWEQLKAAAHKQANSSGSFKRWMIKTHEADYSDDTLRAAVRSMDSIPDDFARLLDLLQRIVTNDTNRTSERTVRKPAI